MNSRKRRQNYTQLKNDLLNLRGDSCEYCLQRRWVDPHHCLIHQRKSNPELDCLENIMAVCRECHESGEVNSWNVRAAFYLLQVERGYDMIKWLDSIPLKIKPDFSRYSWPNDSQSFKDSYLTQEMPLRSLAQLILSGAE